MSEGFFSDEEVKNAAADQPWRKSERDHVLDVYFMGGAGAHPVSLARKLGRNPKAVKRMIEQFVHNERDRAVLYVPFKRVSRKGRKITQNELALIKAHKEKGVSVEATAVVLQRPVADFYKDFESRERFQEMKKFGPGVDLILAYRLLYYCHGISIVSDRAYDEIEAEEKEFGANSQVLNTVGSDNVNDYPHHIRALAMYLGFKYTEKEKT